MIGEDVMFFDIGVSFFQAEFTSKEEALEKMADALFSQDLVTSDFKRGILDRESQFSTGLPTVPFGVAIPHTDTDKVKENQIAFASLTEPVKFQMMGSSGDEVEVSIIFMLAIKNADEHLSTLQKLIEVFQNESLIKKLGECSNQHEFKQILQSVGLE